MKRRLRVVLGLALVGVLLCAGLLGALLSALRPERADPTIVRAKPRERIVRVAPAQDEARRATGERIYGTVTDVDGEPLPDVAVWGEGWSTVTDADGFYEVWVEPGRDAYVRAVAEGYEEARGLVPRIVFDNKPPPDGWPVNMILRPDTGLRVWCAGLPADSCGDVMLQCTTPWSPVGNGCALDRLTGATRCQCPASDQVAIRGGGRAVLVDADEREAWLDFRDAGTLVGRVLLDGAPAAECSVMVFRVPNALEDLPRGMVAARRVRCEADGSFAVEGLVEGDWELVAGSSKDARTRVLVPRRVRRGAFVDVGDIRIPGGGAIEGTARDGLTGAPLTEEPLVAWREGDGGERPTGAGIMTEFDGTFRLQGLPAGTWTVAPALAPQESVTVTVPEDGVVRGVELVTSDATALAENGFSLQEEDDGALVVSDVVEESPAWLAGLEPGEEVTGVLLAGFDVTSALGEHGDDFTRMILGHWDGPGVTLIVRSPDGEEEEVPLEW